MRGRLQFADLGHVWCVSLHSGGRDHADEQQVFIGKCIVLTWLENTQQVVVLNLYIPQPWYLLKKVRGV